MTAHSALSRNRFATPRFSGLLGRVLAAEARFRQRQDLTALDDHMLRDIGITRLQAEAEATKPFWRP